MKNKILSLSLCFTILISSLNINKSYADGGVISAPIVATVVTLASACGLALNSDSDIYSLAYGFYEKHKDNWEDVETVFNACVSIGANKVVTVGKEFKDICLDFFDYYFGDGTSLEIDNNIVPLSEDLTYTFKAYDDYDVPQLPYQTTTKYISTGRLATVGFAGEYHTGVLYMVVQRYYNSRYGEYTIKHGFRIGDHVSTWSGFSDPQISFYEKGSGYGIRSTSLSTGSIMDSSATFTFGSPYIGVSGKYDKTSVGDDNVDISVPSNLGSLVGGVNPLPGVGNPSYDLPLGGIVSIPTINNPSIDIDTTVPFPGSDVLNPPVDTPINPPVDTPTDTPTDTPSDTAWDWLINLVVPSSTYWQDTFDTFFTNIGNAFPMIDIGRFKDLCINGVPPKDIEVTIMGAKGKIFNTKYLNSIVDWLQPIVSAFMAFLLMLYNYRKVYKLIRGFEPFGGVADGQSVGEVRGKMDGPMPEMGNSSFVGPSTASTWSDGQSITRGSIQARYYGRDL